ncbi:branched-chain-amino-acid transaminase [bacterium]|nr:branched-chain-amino-acid transaminase [bacterium]
MAELQVWLDGEFVPEPEAKVSVFDHGILYGDGCFEGIKCWDGKVFKLKEHIERFYDSAHFLDIALVQSKEEIMDAVLRTVAVNDLHSGVCYIRLVATRGKGDLGINPRKCRNHPTVFCIVSSIQLYPEEMYARGLRCITCNTRRVSVQSLPGRVKSLNYLNNILAVIEVNRAGADEGIMLTHQGYVSECTADNIFFAKHGVVKTPAPFLGILEGITRNSVIEIARREGIKVEEGTYLTYDIYTADEVWLTGTGADLIPVVEVDNRVIGGGKPGKLFKLLRSKWMDYVHEPANHSVVPAKEAVLAS